MSGDEQGAASMRDEPRRLRRERRTVTVIIDMFCRHHHAVDAGRCADCGALHDYAMERIGRCPYGEDKPTCANCPIHCYRKAMRQEMRRVMAWSGPRMLKRHPILAILHVIDGYRKAERPRRGTHAA